jgi:type IV pilus assembly protein PilW
MKRTAQLPLKIPHGLSLVELMVAMTIALLVMAAVSTIFVDTKRNYVVQDALARLQENARFATDMIVRDVRMAGYFGCADDVSAIENTLNGAAAGAAYDVSSPLQGSESKSTWYPAAATPVAAPAAMRGGTDAIAVRYLDRATSAQVTGPFMPNTSAALHTAAGNGLQDGDIVFITDCSGGAIFQITGPDDPNNGTIVHNTGGTQPGNSTKDLGKIFEGDASIARYYYAMYYVAAGASGEFSLFRQTVGTAGVVNEELMEGIEDLQVLYGEDTANGDRIPDVYRKADAVTNWGNVVTIRIGLLARTLANSDRSGNDYGGFRDTADGYDVDGDGNKEVNYTAALNDMYQRRVFRATVTLRNAL